MRDGRLFTVSGFLRRALAAGSAALIFALGVLAASPDLHQRLHAGHHSPDDHCAVVLFAGGVSFAPAATAPLPPLAYWKNEPPRSESVFAGSPRYLLLPGRGPPAT
jgi:hypothetical protein